MTEPLELVERLKIFAINGRDPRCTITLNQYHSKLIDEAADALERREALLREAREALTELEGSVGDYRMKHDMKGDGHPETGRAWDLMKAAQAKARQLISRMGG